MEKYQHDQRHQNDGESDIVHNGIYCIEGKIGRIGSNFKFEPFRLVLVFQDRHFSFDALGYGNGIGVGLFLYDNPNGADPVDAADVRRFLWFIPDFCNICNPDRGSRPGAIGNNELPEVVQVQEFAGEAHEDLGVFTFYFSGWEFQICLLDRLNELEQ